MIDELGTRMKSQYEDRTRYAVPRRTYTIIRLDGKAFHTYTRGLLKPFDHDLITDMSDAIIAMMPEIQGAQFAYQQSDEISILLTDFALPTTSAWFDGNIQKIASVSASIMTAQFNLMRYRRGFELSKYRFKNDPECVGRAKLASNLAFFDSRVFTIPDRIEVMNYFIWRNQDCARNSVSMLAQSMYLDKELHGKSTSEKIQMTKDYSQGEQAWGSLNQDLKFGRLIRRDRYLTDQDQQHVQNAWDTITGNAKHDLSKIPVPVQRTRWIELPAWRFTDDKEALLKLIPAYE